MRASNPIGYWPPRQGVAPEFSDVPTWNIGVIFAIVVRRLV